MSRGFGARPVKHPAEPRTALVEELLHAMVGRGRACDGKGRCEMKSTTVARAAALAFACAVMPAAKAQDVPKANVPAEITAAQWRDDLAIMAR